MWLQIFQFKLVKFSRIAAFGFYGVLAYDVARRIHEIGIRLALGATSGRVVQILLLRGFRLVATGTVVGLVAALYGTRLIEGMLFETDPTDPATFAIMSVLFAIVTALVSIVPARRVIRLDPTVVLQTEQTWLGTTAISSSEPGGCR